MASVILLQSGEAIPHALTGAETVLGRHPECALQINSNMVSRKHARIYSEGEKYYIEDLDSGNGTFVNGKKIDAPVLLQHEDRLKLGPVLLRFEDPSQARKAALPPPPRRSAVKSSPFINTESVNFAAGEEDSATIMGSTAFGGGYGALEVQPEAKLRAVLEISRSLAGSADLNGLLPKIMDSLFKIFPAADRGVILFRHEGTAKMQPQVIKYRRPGEDDSVKLSRTIIAQVMEQKTGILSADASNDARFDASESISSLTIRSMMCVPLLSLEHEVMGIIHIDTQSAYSQFKKDDLDLLLAVAGQAALSYETARLLVTAMEKQRQDREMDIAMNVQRALLPETMPAVPGYEFFASYDSAQAVGGDYYDCIPLGPDKVCFAFGDVAGKGVPASLVMSRLSSVVQNVMQFVTDVGQAAQLINRQMCAKAVEGRFVTFILGVLDVPTGELHVVNAGHMPLMIRKPDGTVEEFGAEAVGIPLGVMEDFPFDVVSRCVTPGENVVIYTDGVSEAMNPSGDLYGIDRLTELVKRKSGHAEEMGKTILADVRSHANGRPQNDDITIMVLSRTGVTPAGAEP